MSKAREETVVVIEEVTDAAEEEVEEVVEVVEVVEEDEVVQDGKGNVTNKGDETKVSVTDTKTRKSAGSKAGDFIGRVGTLAVMAVTTLSAILLCVSSFVDEIWWQAGLYLGLIVFVHVPVLVTMIYFMCKTGMTSVVRTVRRRRRKVIGVEASTKSEKSNFKGPSGKTSNVRTRSARKVTRTKVGRVNKGFNGAPA